MASKRAHPGLAVTSSAPKRGRFLPAMWSLSQIHPPPTGAWCPIAALYEHLVSAEAECSPLRDSSEASPPYPIFCEPAAGSAPTCSETEEATQSSPGAGGEPSSEMGSTGCCLFTLQGSCIEPGGPSKERKSGAC
ncbi:hypothetical protein V5799_021925 [Amblyomma americanum]|uniref:Uncharacterized protein n=1 Tax=Amblyomma americanum TaxID=6943 RepID=A0AAQ4FNF9_AMBAM